MTNIRYYRAPRAKCAVVHISINGNYVACGWRITDDWQETDLPVTKICRHCRQVAARNDEEGLLVPPFVLPPDAAEVLQ